MRFFVEMDGHPVLVFPHYFFKPRIFGCSGIIVRNVHFERMFGEFEQGKKRYLDKVAGIEIYDEDGRLGSHGRIGVGVRPF